MYCQDEVQPKHVKEAFRLLGKSIIRVEQPDIHLEESGAPESMDVEDDTVPSSETPAVTQSSRVDGDSTPSAPAAADPPKKSMKLSYEDYKHMANLLVLHMRRVEEHSVDDEDSGVRRSQLVEWYLTEIQADIESEVELIEKKMIVEKVIYRLVHHDHVLIQLEKTGLRKREKDQEDSVVEDDPILVVHPNYVIDV